MIEIRNIKYLMRELLSSLGSLNQKRTNILYHFNDWFNYGLTKDLKKFGI